MDIQNQNPEDQNQTPDEAPNKKKGGIHNNALYAASMGRAATAAVNPHDNSGLAQTGTNVSYEGPTAPGSGGSVGTGYASGKSATTTRPTEESDFDHTSAGRRDTADDQQDADQTTI